MTCQRIRILLVTIALLPGCQPNGTNPQAASVKKQLPPTPSAMQTQTLGTSVQQRPIMLYRFGEGPVGTLVIGGIHGDETTAIRLAERLIELLKTGQVTGFDGSVAVIPIANPDGAVAGKRTNAHRVDLNRNFPAKNWSTTQSGRYHGGSNPLSEPESTILQNAVESLRPRRIISIHSITRGRECNNYDGPAEELAKRMSAKNGYPVTANIGYPTPGSFGSWAGIDLRIPVITLELPRDLPAEKAWEGNRQALLEAIRMRAP